MNTKKSWNDKCVFVTGATGLVGYWLVRELNHLGAHVIALIRDFDPQSEFIRSGLYLKTTLVNGCLEDLNAVRRAINEHEVDTVFHLGAQTIVGTAYRDPLQTFEANIRGSYHLLEACRLNQSHVKRVVIASSDKAYGTSDILPYHEDMPLIGRHPYDVSKSCTDLIAQTYYHTYHLPIAIARCGNIFGGGDLNWSRVIPGTIRSLYLNEKPVIRSNGSPIRDYIYVQDVVSAYLSLALSLDDPAIAGQAFNFSPNIPLSALDVVQSILQMMKKEHLQPHILNKANAEIQDQYLSCEKAQVKLNWSTKYTFKEALIETIAWYTDYLDSLFKKSQI